MEALDKFADFGLGIGVVQAEHRDEMLDWLEFGEGRAADALGGRLGCGQVREFFFEFEQLAIEAVVLLVADGWPSMDVIGLVMTTHFCSKRKVALRSGSPCHCG